MIVFHEGLPGSGKSYEAMAERIVPAITAKRQVVAYVEGIDHAKVAELAGVTEELCRELLHVLTREQMGEWLTHCRDNALHVFDEAQNFWGNRAKLNAAETELVTEHRHRGMDIVLMGQDLRDVHATWRRRVELKLCFLKLNGLGMAGRYSVTTFRHLGGDQFSRAGLTVRKYDPRFFGSYKSHVSDDTNAGVYTDKRAQLWSHAGFRYGLPLAVAAAIWGGYTAWAFFQPETHKITKSEAKPSAPVQSAAATPPGSLAAPIAQQPQQTAQQPAKPVDERSPIERRMATLSESHRIRLAGVIAAGDKFDGYVEWVDSGSRVMERLSFNALREMGVAVLRSEGFVRLAVGAWVEVATMWPTEAEGRLSQARLDGMRPAQQQYAAAPVVGFNAALPGPGSAAPAPAGR